MLEIILYTATGIFLYLVSDAALNQIEKMHGEPLPNRSIIFFAIIFLLAMVLFPMIRMGLGAGA
ncbi:MAG: hypothetical protein CMQ20_04905 [Gammaproteobacteria bacterium]|jgi:zinc transporter ZupT|nr:hypothetical protein [Gammaproteobacteria bacterium]|tara:strand:- start:105 stop:296 length:192 start_codon:yes stop_codon:yes gene_type:complete